jgi:dGTP triphosphohydrolase
MVEFEYHESVNQIEAGLIRCAKRSFEPSTPFFVDGGEIFPHFASQWEKGNQFKLRHRTPIQLERDRILYSQGMRKQTEKYHVLYNGQRRIVRAYATHTMKMAQVARAICRGLSLNQDFAEAIALGAKVGAVPFVHASKQAMSTWAEEKIGVLDQKSAKDNPLGTHGLQQLALDFDVKAIPTFVTKLQSSVVFDKVRRYMPWAAGQREAKLYTSGQESYWLLCTNPFTTEALRNAYFPETMYAIWRHTRGLLPGLNPFSHKCLLSGATRGYNEISDKHATFEGIVVQYADDITWVIENLNDANDVALLNDRAHSVYDGLTPELGSDVDPALDRALRKNDAGGIYTYFITDFVNHSSEMLAKSGGGFELRAELSKGSSAVRIGLSPEAEALLNKMIKYLNGQIFTEPRTKNRTEMLRSISSACVELIYTSEDVLPRVVRENARLGRWNEDSKKAAIELLTDSVHRVQTSMDVLASWGDQEIYDFVGIQSL